MKPTDHPLWPAFAEWVRARNRTGAAVADHPIWWDCFTAGADAREVRAAVALAAVSVRNLGAPAAAEPARYESRQSDADLLRLACDGPTPDDRRAALDAITKRMGGGGCCPKVSLLAGALRRLNPDTPAAARRQAVAAFAVKYGLEFTPWW